MKKIFLFLFLMFCAACAQNRRVSFLERNFQADDKSLFFLSDTGYESEIREALVEKGFKVLKFSSQQDILEDVSKTNFFIHTFGDVIVKNHFCINNR